MNAAAAVRNRNGVRIGIESRNDDDIMVLPFFPIMTWRDGSGYGQETLLPMKKAEPDKCYTF